MSLFLGEQPIKKLNVVIDSIAAQPALEEKTIEPTQIDQAITPSEGYDGLSKVVVKGIVVEGLTATDNGTYTAGNYYKTITVNIPYTTYRTGSGTPSNSLGVDGDLYFDLG